MLTNSDCRTREAEHISDEELIEQYRSGDGALTRQALFVEIFGRYHARIAFWCYRMTRDRELALDLVQDIFLKAYRRIDSFRSDAKLSTWLFTITRNHCIDAIHKRAGEPESGDTAMLQMADAHSPNIEAELQRRQKIRIMMHVVNGCLNRTEARIMTLHYGHDMPLAAVTGLLGLRNQSGAKAYIVSARRKLARVTPSLRLAIQA